MAFQRVTIQDIADACGVSRNTVSKVFNDRGAVQEATRQMILKKAQEMGYYSLPSEEVSPPEIQKKNVALFTCHMPADYHFGTFFIPAFAGQLGRAGYTLTMYELSEEEVRQKSLPPHFNPDQTAGVMGIELFDRKYIERICQQNLPVIIVDGCYGDATSLIPYDRISMENISSMFALVNHAILRGARRLGFVGDPEHCSSFQERWYGFATAVTRMGISVDKNLCILDRDDSPYDDPSWLAARIRQMPHLPDALICVNDYVALNIVLTLKQMGLSIPDQIMVTGFDGTPQSSVVEPALTTVQIPGAEIGRIAADMLLNRIANPDRSSCSMYVRTTPLFRESTNRL